MSSCKKLETLAPGTRFKKNGRLYVVICQYGGETRVREIGLVVGGLSAFKKDVKAEVVDLEEHCP